MITVDIEAALRQIGVLGSSLPGLLSRDQAGPAVVSEYARLNREFFDSGGDGSWPPLEHSTLEFKRRTGLPLAPMVRSGRLRNAVTDPFGSGAGDVELVFAGDQITWSLRGPHYAAFAIDSGDDRPVFDEGEEADQRIAQVLDEFITRRGG